MKFLYMWIEQFKNIHNQGFVVDNEYIVDIINPDVSSLHYYTKDGAEIHFSGAISTFDRRIFKRTAIIRKNENYKEINSDFVISNIAVLAGGNATGKSNILECLYNQSDRNNNYEMNTAAYFIAYLNNEKSSIIIRTKDIWLTNQEAEHNYERTMGYDEYILPLTNNKQSKKCNHKDIIQIFSLSLQRNIGIYNEHKTMGFNAVCGNLDTYNYRNSFKGIFNFLCDYPDLGERGNKFVLYLENGDGRSGTSPYFTHNNLKSEDYKYLFIHKTAQILFGNLREYLFRPKREYSIDGTVLFPSPEHEQLLNDDDYKCAEVMSFTNLTYPLHPSRGIGIFNYSKTNKDYIDKIYKALQFFEECTFIYHDAAKLTLKDYLQTLKRLFEELIILNAPCFTALYKVELDFIEEYKDFMVSLYNLFADSCTNEEWAKGIIVDFEWFSAGETHLTRLFSAIYQLFSSSYKGFGKRHIILSIDEPEMHMHPETSRVLLSNLADVLARFRENRLLCSCQIVLATHSPFIIQQLSSYNSSISLVTKKMSKTLIRSFDNIDEIKFPDHSSYSFSLVMYKIFDVSTVELHNELYGILQEKNQCYYEKDIEKWFANKGLSKTHKWIMLKEGIPQPPVCVTLQTFIRHSIHHPENTHNNQYSNADFRRSINEMIKLLFTNKL